MKSSRFYIINIALVFISLAFAAGMMEIIFRVFMPQNIFLYQPDQILGSSLIPNRKGFVKVENQIIPVKINKWGFRGWEAEKEKSAKIVRIAVLGDSYVEALQVEEQNMFTRKLEKYLNEKGGINKFEVLAFGVSGYGTAQQYLLYENYVKQFQPDIVISLFTLANDVRNNYYPLEQELNKPYFVFNNQEQLELVSSKYNNGLIKSINRFFLKYSEFYRFIIPKFLRVFSKNGIISDVPMDYNLFNCNEQKNWTEAWKITKAILQKLQQTIESDRREWFLVNETSYPQIHGQEALKALFALYPKMKEACWDLQKPNRILNEWASQNNVKHLDLLSSFINAYQKEKEEYHLLKDGHWNEKGHALAAKIIANWLLEKQYLTKNR